MFGVQSVKHGLRVKRNTVMNILRLADPEGVKCRRMKRFRRRTYVSPGPNYLWHLDGYDKLKPFGFAIHGCIDGYARKILWLEVATSNNNPKIISYYYLKAVERLGKVPRIIRADKGTENSNVAIFQSYFRYGDDDSFGGVKSFIVGKSTANQKVECWWSQMRRRGIDWWISHFKDLRDRGLLNNNDPIQTECLRYAYHKVLENDLHELAQLWNQHKIRKQKNRELPAGKPDVLYHLPQSVNVQDFGCPVQEDDVAACLGLDVNKPQYFDETFGKLVELLIPGVQVPNNIDDAHTLYFTLVDKLKEY